MPIFLFIVIQRLLDRFKYSSDQQGVSDQLLDHSRLCQEILSFQSRIDQCYSDAVSAAAAALLSLCSVFTVKLVLLLH